MICLVQSRCPETFGGGNSPNGGRGVGAIESAPPHDGARFGTNFALHSLALLLAVPVVTMTHFVSTVIETAEQPLKSVAIQIKFVDLRILNSKQVKRESRNILIID